MATLRSHDGDTKKKPPRSLTTLPVYLLVQNWRDPAAAAAACARWLPLAECAALSPHRALWRGGTSLVVGVTTCTLSLAQSVAAGCLVAMLVGAVYAVRCFALLVELLTDLNT